MSHVGFQKLKSPEVLMAFVYMTHDYTSTGNYGFRALKTGNNCEPV